MSQTATPTAREIALILIRHYEGTRLYLYDDATGKPAPPGGSFKGNPTCGTGHLLRVDDKVASDGSITQDQADAWLDADIRAASSVVYGKLGANLTSQLTAPQIGALIDLAFNLGGAPFKASTGLAGDLCARDFESIPDQLRKWRKAGGEVLLGLQRRREAEALVWQGVDPQEAIRQAEALFPAQKASAGT
jgi:lysozyme